MDDDGDMIISSTEIIKDRLYFATLKAGFTPKATRNSKYFHIEDEIVYEGFFFDFGPYHLCHLYQFCNKLNEELEKNPKKKIVFYTSDKETLRLNAAYLIGSYQIIYLNAVPSEVYKQLTKDSRWTLLGFIDCCSAGSVYDIPLSDVLQGVKIAFDAHFFDFNDFDEEQYLYYEKVENGDLSWIIPQKMLAFLGPQQESNNDNGYLVHSPEFYHDYFKQHNVTTIVRLNKKTYNSRRFTKNGFDHHHLYFVDGSVPTDRIVNRFIQISENAKGAIAVHCRAGLGRTGTLIGCYMMKHHGFSAREAIAWLRVCRPGSVIGYQQLFLEQLEKRMHAEGATYRRRHNITSLPVFTRGIYSTLPPEPLRQSEPRSKPVNLATILNNRSNKMDNDNILNANNTDSENNVTTVIGKYKTTPTAMLPTRTLLTPKYHYMTPTSNINNASNTNLKPTRVALMKSDYAAKTCTFPPTRGSSSTASAFGPVKSTLKTPSTVQRKLKPRIGANVTSTLTTLTENCHLNGKSRMTSEPNLKTSPIKSISNIKIARKTPKIRPKKVIKTSAEDEAQEMTSSDTNINLVGTRPPFRFRKKPESQHVPMECISNSIITADVTPENYEETANSQGNKLCKIKALRKKCPTFLKNESVRQVTPTSSVKKK